MTNEEIEKVAMQLLHDLGYDVSDWSLPTATTSLRALVSQAYEEAAQKCDEITAEVVERTGLAGYDHLSGHQSATAIRALKDSLQPETASATSSTS